MLVADCPRCGAKKITFDVLAAVRRGTSYNWKRHFEVCCLCRQCIRPSIFKISDSEIDTAKILPDERDFAKSEYALNKICSIDGLVNFAEVDAKSPPEHLPVEVHDAYLEGSRCFAIGCYNASGAMFRLSVDLATQPLLPDPSSNDLSQPNQRQRRDLGLRLPWLFEHNLLPSALTDLATCIREDGNDGVHAGNLTREDAEDLMDFAFELHERLYTEPERLRIAAQRRIERRQGK
jgi:hypothetical protein